MEDLPAHPQAGDVENIFAAALGLSPAERPAYLSAACGGNTALRRRVEALLRAHEEVEDFLPEQPKHHPAVPQITEQLGDKIGRYRIMEKIGEGGCGIVYVAEQEEPVRRKVALKVIKLGMDTREVVARFEAERQALASMDHPNIAKVFDAGVTGIPLTRPADTLSPTGGDGRAEQTPEDLGKPKMVRLQDSSLCLPQIFGEVHVTGDAALSAGRFSTIKR